MPLQGTPRAVFWPIAKWSNEVGFIFAACQRATGASADSAPADWRRSRPNAANVHAMTRGKINAVAASRIRMPAAPGSTLASARPSTRRLLSAAPTALTRRRVPAAARLVLPPPRRRLPGATVWLRAARWRADSTISVALFRSVSYCAAMRCAKASSSMATSISQLDRKLAIFRLLDPTRAQRRVGDRGFRVQHRAVPLEYANPGFEQRTISAVRQTRDEFEIARSRHQQTYVDAVVCGGAQAPGRRAPCRRNRHR